MQKDPSSIFEYLPIAIAIIYSIWQWLKPKKEEENKWDGYLNPNNENTRLEKKPIILSKDIEVIQVDNDYIDENYETLTSEQNALENNNENIEKSQETSTYNATEKLHDKAYSLEEEVKISPLQKIITKYPPKKAAIILNEILIKKQFI